MQVVGNNKQEFQRSFGKVIEQCSKLQSLQIASNYLGYYFAENKLVTNLFASLDWHIANNNFNISFWRELFEQPTLNKMRGVTDGSLKTTWARRVYDEAAVNLEEC